MERRKILLGSGVALTTALAGCFGSDGDDEPSDDEPDEAETETEADTDPDDEYDPTIDEVPGVDESELALNTDALRVTRVEHTGSTVEVEAETAGYQAYESVDELGAAILGAVYDPATLKEEVDSVSLTLLDDGETIFSSDIGTRQIYDHIEGDYTNEELIEKLRADEA